MIISGLIILLEALGAFFTGTLVYDVVHYFLHHCLKSKNRWLHLFGHFHSTHHHFFSPTLHIEKKWTAANIRYHLIPEYCIQVAGISLCVFFFSPWAIGLAIFFQTFIFCISCYNGGVDKHHVSYTHVPAYKGGIFVTAAYHALHHVYPTQYIGSYLKIIDCIFGTAHHLAGKRIAITGASGALGSNMKRLLEKEGAIITTFKYGTDYTYDNYEKLRDSLANTDILLLCHGSKYDHAQEANCDSFISIIELFKSVREKSLVPMEVWGVGSEIECHPCFGIKKLQVYARSKRNYARQAKLYFHDTSMQYRHIVHSAFTSQMGPGLIPAKWAAFLTLFLIKRGFRYVPVTYTGIAFVNYFRFVFKRANVSLTNMPT